MKEWRFYPGSLSIEDNKIRKKNTKSNSIERKKVKGGSVCVSIYIYIYIYIYKQHSSLSFGFFFSNS